MILLCIVLGAVIFTLLGILSKWFEEPKSLGTKKAAIGGIVVAIASYLAPKVPAGIAMLLLILMLATMGYMVYYWMENGSTVKELTLISGIDTMFHLVALSCAARIWDLTSWKWLSHFVTWLPTATLVISIGFFIANMIWFHESLERGDFNEEA